MLSETEKEALYQTIVTVFGEDHSLRQYKNGFNERTVQIVEPVFVNVPVRSIIFS